MLRLSALDVEDLAVISAQMQDAVLLAGDMRYDPKRKQFALVANRFAWDEAERRRSAAAPASISTACSRSRR